MITDTIHHVKPLVQASQSNSNFDLVYYVNNYYEQAWNKLIWTIGAILAIVGTIVGVVIPLVIQHYQKQRAKESDDRLREEITKSTENAKKEIKAEIAIAIADARQEIDVAVKSLIAATRDEISKSIETASGDLRIEIAALVSDTKNEIGIAIEDSKSEMLSNATTIMEERATILDSKFERVENSLMARSFQIQGNLNIQSKNYDNAIIHYILAAEHYLNAEEIEQSKGVLNLTLKFIKLNDLTKDGVQRALEFHKMDLEKRLKAIIKKQKDFKEIIIKILGTYKLLLAK